MRVLRLAVPLMLLAGCMPNDIARTSCQSVFLSTVDAWTCTVGADEVGRRSSISFDTESRNQVAEVIITMNVTKGTLRLGYQDLTGPQQILVTPSEPVNLTMKTRLRRDTRSFSLNFEPVNGPVRGLSGTVKYSTP